MFTRIDIERVRNKLSVKGLSERSGIKYDTLLMKLNGHTEFTRAEMLKIQAAFPHKISLDDLFASEDDRDSA